MRKSNPGWRIGCFIFAPSQEADFCTPPRAHTNTSTLQWGSFFSGISVFFLLPEVKYFQRTFGKSAHAFFTFVLSFLTEGLAFVYSTHSPRASRKAEGGLPKDYQVKSLLVSFVRPHTDIHRDGGEKKGCVYL